MIYFLDLITSESRETIDSLDASHVIGNERHSFFFFFFFLLRHRFAGTDLTCRSNNVSGLHTP